MIPFFKKSLILLFFTLFIGHSSVFASGKMEVGIGQSVQLVAESDLFSPSYKWVVTKGADILSTQTAKNFNYTFLLQGEYNINLTATAERQVENTNINVLVGDRYPRPYSPKNPEGNTDGSSNLAIKLETLPSIDESGRVELLGDGRLQFSLEGSTGDILEYRIDKNIFIDSDGNGIANDDIDNAQDDSYLIGGTWLANYTQDESSKIAAEVTLVDKGGKKVKKQIEIIFGSIQDLGDLVAQLQTLPTKRSGQDNVRLYKDPHVVSFYSRGSTGKILEYRIDKNIFEDTNGDGDPKNDIDNINDISFKTGDVFEVSYPKTDQQIIAQLIVVAEDGKGSRVQVGLEFGEPLLNSDLDPDSGESKGIRLSSDKNLVFKGDPILFTVEGLSLALDQYEFEWDFDGDGLVDKVITADKEVEHIYEEAGIFPVQVNIIDTQGNSASRQLDIIVKDEILTRADFDFFIDQNTVTFADLSTSGSHLSNPTLNYQWNFGDTDPEGYEQQKDQIGLESPVYTYKKAGNYIVTLTVTDSDGVVDTKTADLQIVGSDLSTNPNDVNNQDNTNADQKQTSFFVSALKVILYLLLGLLLLLVLGVAGFLIFLKVQHPDLTFEELIDEFKVKVLTMIGAHDEISAQSQPQNGFPKPPTSNTSATEPSPTESPIMSDLNKNQSNDDTTQSESGVAEDDSIEIKPPVFEKGPVPSWLQDKDIVEGEVDTSSSFDENDESTSDDEFADTELTDDESNSGDQSLDDDSFDENDFSDDSSDSEDFDDSDDSTDDNDSLDEDLDESVDEVDDSFDDELSDDDDIDFSDNDELVDDTTNEDFNEDEATDDFVDEPPEDGADNKDIKQDDAPADDEIALEEGQEVDLSTAQKDKKDSKS